MKNKAERPTAEQGMDVVDAGLRLYHSLTPIQKDVLRSNLGQMARMNHEEPDLAKRMVTHCAAVGLVVLDHMEYGDIKVSAVPPVMTGHEREEV